MPSLGRDVRVYCGETAPGTVFVGSGGRSRVTCDLCLEAAPMRQPPPRDSGRAVLLPPEAMSVSVGHNVGRGVA